jgi:aspartate/methionine/tyrosine aminotransferase
MMRDFVAIRARDLVAGSLRSEPPSGVGLIRLDSGDPDFPTPAPVVEETMRALHGGHTHYVHPQGDADLRDALSAQLSACGRHVSSA